MGARFHYQVSFRASHASMPVAELVAALPGKPGRTWMAGEPRHTPTGNLLEGVYCESYCVCDIGAGDDGELAVLLDRALGTLEDRAETLRDLRARGASFGFFVTWSPTGDAGETFEADLLGRMGALGIALGLNVLPTYD